MKNQKYRYGIMFKPSFPFQVSHSTLIIALCFLLYALCFSSCKKFLEIPPPTTQVVTASVFNNASSATSAQVAIYAEMRQNAESYYLSANMGLYGDELQSHSTDIGTVQLYTNALSAANSRGWGVYDNGFGYYNYIYQANAVISGLQTTSGVSAAVKQQLTGEAYFIRAFCHFYLTNIYGDVPLVLTTDYTITSKLARTPRVQVLQQVVNDLTAAEGMLNTNYVDAATDTTVTTERVRPNKAAAAALLARAYLYLADYGKDASNFANAETEAGKVIGNSKYSLSSLSGVFLANSSEAIWQLQTPSPPPFSDTPEGLWFILLAAPSNGVYNSNTISQELMGSFESNDQRKTTWIGSITEGANTYYFPYKYKNYTYVNTEYDMVLRLGEQYLIRAEAETEEGKTSNAIADLNIIRNRAGLPNYAGATDQASLLTAIMHERQVELFTEWGARWFDLCRAIPAGISVNANSVMGSPGNVCQAKGGTWNSNDYQLLFPIFQQDIARDVNLTQNPGY